MKKEKKLLQTAGRGLREQIEGGKKSGGFLSIHALDHGKLDLDDKSYVLKFGEGQDFKAVREVIEDRRRQLPAFSWWRCENPACRWKAKMDRDLQEPFTCLKCNSQRYEDGSWMKRMTAKEIEEYEKDVAQNIQKEVEQRRKAKFYETNVNRGQAGLPPLSWQQFLDESAAAHRLELERADRLSVFSKEVQEQKK